MQVRVFWQTTWSELRSGYQKVGTCFKSVVPKQCQSEQTGAPWYLPNNLFFLALLGIVQAEITQNLAQFHSPALPQQNAEKQGRCDLSTFGNCCFKLSFQKWNAFNSSFARTSKHHKDGILWILRVLNYVSLSDYFSLNREYLEIQRNGWKETAGSLTASKLRHKQSRLLLLILKELTARSADINEQKQSRPRLFRTYKPETICLVWMLSYNFFF